MRRFYNLGGKNKVKFELGADSIQFCRSMLYGLVVGTDNLEAEGSSCKLGQTNITGFFSCR
ncbi:MAG: hypothetical protein PHS44_05380 [Candidatus Dojkabacteria bacterium]|nr:hypothetical protein [Candidatus Dojkabacteria bacterium]